MVDLLTAILNIYNYNNFNLNNKSKFNGIGFGNEHDKTSSYQLAKILKTHKLFPQTLLLWSGFADL